MPSAPPSLAPVLALLLAGCAAQPGPQPPHAPVAPPVAAEGRPVQVLRDVPTIETPPPPEVAADGARCLGTEPAIACLEACWKNDASACASLAQACEEGDGTACSYAAHYLLAHDRRPPNDPTRIVRYLDTACAGGLVATCIILARLYTHGAAGVAKDPARAQAANERAAEQARLNCEKNDQDGCMSFGSFAEHGIGVDKNAAASRRAFAKGFALMTAACGLRDGLSCHMLGVYYLDGTGAPANREKARTFLERACALPWKSTAASCATLEQAFGPPPKTIVSP